MPERMDGAITTRTVETKGEASAISRRRVVQLGGASAVGVATLCGLAACSSGSGDDANAAVSTTSSTPPAEGADQLAKLSDIPVGSAIKVDTASGSVILAQPQAGQVVGYKAVCPHKGGDVVPDGDTLVCKLHFAEFTPRTGEVTKGPAESSLPGFAVKLEGDSVVPA